MSVVIPIITFLLIFPLAGCKREEIETVRIPKEVAGHLPGQPREASSSRAVDWAVPKGWQEKPLTTMRVGSFLIVGENGMQADISVIPLRGEAGGDLSNINRWRGQINLNPLSPAELKSNSQIIKSDGREMLFVNFVSQEPLIDNKFKMRLLAAITQAGGQTWFFKMMGEDQTVKEAKPSFLEFLMSLRFHEDP